MDPKSQLERLLRIQELALEMRGARNVVTATPGRIEGIEGRFRERNAEYVAVRERHDSLEKDQRDRQGQLGLLEENLKKYMDSLMQVKNQREYAAMLKEIDAVKAQIAAHEEAVLKDMEELESLHGDLEARSAHIATERAQVDQEGAQVEADASAARELIARCQAERARIEAELPGDLVDNVHRVEDARQGIFLTRAEREMCQACFVRIRPQVFQEIRQNFRIHVCSNCRRYLYFEPSLRSASASVTGIGAVGLEAQNGGAA